MESKLYNLTQKIYQEGIEKANVERQKIIDDARREASAILASAMEQADEVRKKAEKEAEQLKQTITADLKVGGIHAISELKQRIKNLVAAKVLEAPAKVVFFDAEFLKELILTLARNSDLKQGVELKLAPELREKMETAVADSIRKEISGITISYDPKVSGGFTISPKNASYKISFTDRDFIEFFRPFVRERAEKLLFEKE